MKRTGLRSPRTATGVVKAGLASTLDAVPGIGPIKRRRLLSHFGSIEAIKQASIEELVAIQGITQADAEMLKSQLA